MPDEQLRSLDEALTRLGETDARAAESRVKLHYFVGLAGEQLSLASTLGLSPNGALPN
jgi:hypothetical protein